MPRWVKVSLVVVLLVVAALAILVSVGGNHGPGRHAGAVGSIGRS